MSADVFGADPGQVGKGAGRFDSVFDLAAKLHDRAKSVYFNPDGNGPVAKAVRTTFTPAKEDTDNYLLLLGAAFGHNGGKTALLAHHLHNVGESAAADAASWRPPSGRH